MPRQRRPIHTRERTKSAVKKSTKQQTLRLFPSIVEAKTAQTELKQLLLLMDHSQLQLNQTSCITNQESLIKLDVDAMSIMLFSWLDMVKRMAMSTGSLKIPGQPTGVKMVTYVLPSMELAEVSAVSSPAHIM